MVYQSGKMTLNCVMEVFCGKVNNVEICENVQDGRSTYFTVLVIKEHDTVRKLMNIIEASQMGRERYVDMFDSSKGFCVVLDYVKERKLTEFFMAKDMPLQVCEDICLNLVVQCMTSGLPYPLLELVIKQGQLQLMKDNGVAISYAIDLEELDENCTEARCVMQCAIRVRDMLEKKVSKKNVGYQLLTKKIPKQSYTSFRELYKDIRLATTTARKKKIWEKVKAFVARNDSKIFRGFLFASIILLLFTGIVILSRMLWGEVPLLRLFINTFQQIGTESLVG